MEPIDIILTAVGSGGGSFAISQAVTKWRLNRLEKDHESQLQATNEKFAGVSAAKKAAKMDIENKIEKEVATIHKRIDACKEELLYFLGDDNYKELENYKLEYLKEIETGVKADA